MNMLSRRSLFGLAGSGLTSLLFLEASRHSFGAPSTRPDLRLGLFSDINSSYGSTNYLDTVAAGIKFILASKPDQVICAGDMIAGQKLSHSPAKLDTMWQSFNRQILEPIRAAGLPFLFSLGNHDASASMGSNGYIFEADRAAANRFWQPRKHQLGLNYIDSAGFPFYYTAELNNIFWLVWDASSAQISNQQQNWAREQLASSSARKAKIRIALGHLPLRGVSRGRDQPGEVLDQANKLQQILEIGGVHAYISGHQHSYYPARLGKLDLIQLGATGSGPRQLIVDTKPPRQSITLLDVFWQQREISETSYSFPGGKEINWDELPISLPSRNGPLLRRISKRSSILN